MGRLQFSLAALFAVVTAAAVLLAAVLYIPLFMVVAVTGLMITGAFLGLGLAVLVLVALLERVVVILSPLGRPHRRR